MGKIKHPESIRKIPLAYHLRYEYPRDGTKQFIETYTRETQTLPQPSLKQNKVLIREGLAGPGCVDSVIKTREH